MKQRPILFSAPMVRAILDGSKTQTRRVVTLPCKRVTKTYGDVDIREVNYYTPPSGRSQDGWADPGVNYHTYDKTDGHMIGNHIDPCPYGEVGDQLWVRETWRMYSFSSLTTLNGNSRKTFEQYGIEYKAGVSSLFIARDFYDEKLRKLYDSQRGDWRPSIYMPRLASRIQLEITNIRIEQLNSIKESDAIAEGVERIGATYSCNPWRNYRISEDDEMDMHCSIPSRSFMTLWESINGAGSWAANPWVWVVEFKRIQS